MARLEPAVPSGSLLKLYQALWAPYYQAVLNILGSTGTILPIGDPHHGQPNASTFTTKGEEQLTFTWSEAPSSFDTPLDLTDPDSFQGIVPVIDFNGSDEEVDTPDHDYFSNGADGTAPNEPAMSFGAWVRSDGSGQVAIMARFDATAAAEQREFHLFWNIDKITVRFYDNSSGDRIGRVTPNASVTAWRWYHAVVTKGTGVTASSIKIYVDGARSDVADDNSGTYVALEGTDAPLGVAFQHSDGGAGFFDGKMAGGPVGPFFVQKELTKDEVRALYDLGRAALGL